MTTAIQYLQEGDGRVPRWVPSKMVWRGERPPTSWTLPKPVTQEDGSEAVDGGEWVEVYTREEVEATIKLFLEVQQKRESS